MRIGKGKVIGLLSGFCIIWGFYAVYSNEAKEIHTFVNTASSCYPCHRIDNKNNIIDPAIACSVMCVTCHKEMENHHAINIKINDKLPDELLLTAKKRITCVTCHNLKIRRFDNSSWKAQSLYEKIFKGTPVYKTYFLVTKNNNGQLCKTCH